MNIILIEGDGIDIEYVGIPAKQAKRILKTGISEADLDELISHSSTESGVCNARVVVGGKTIRSLAVETFSPERVYKLASRKGWHLVKEQTERGAFRKIDFDGPFDLSKLKCSASFYELNGFQFSYLDFSYDDNEGEFAETVTHYGGDWFILNPDGVRQSFEVFEDEDEDEDEDDKGDEIKPGGVDLELSCPSKDSLDAVRSNLADGWEVEVREMADGGNYVLLVTGKRGVLRAVDQVVRQEALFGCVITRWI